MKEAGLNEAETRAELIDPALKEAGWGVMEASRVRREVITLGRLQGGGKRARQDIADYVLIYRGQKLAVIEAKKRSLPVTEGLAQAKRYAERLQTRFAYATNGDGIYRVDMGTGTEGPVDAWPSPDGLWVETFGTGAGVQDSWRERFGAVPFEDKGGFWQARYYQHNAINQALEAVAAGRDRILLTWPPAPARPPSPSRLPGSCFMPAGVWRHAPRARLFRDLPELFKDEDELRRLWGRPDTRKKLLEGLEEKGYGRQELADVGKLIEAEHSDLYDVLAYIAFNMAPVSRAERVDAHKARIFHGHHRLLLFG